MIGFLFGNRKNLVLEKYGDLITEINELESSFKQLTDIELRTKNLQFQKEYKETQNLDNLIARSFALTREASVRTLGLRHFDVQLLAGLVLNDNKIAEMKTGEGKTLVATLPASLNALTKKGVHIITVNDYLANRDQVSMGQVYRFLGLDTGLIQTDMNPAARKINYNADITYVTNSELTFDYLRDNTTLVSDNIVLPAFNYCIVDEVDSVLIDEAQTPIIIADTIKNTPAEKYIIASEITNYLRISTHYRVDEKNKNVTLTNSGSKIVEQITQTQDLYNTKDPWIPYIKNALLANSLYFKDSQYIVQNERIVIVDEFTGRIMPDRRWGDGLHQALEAKERLPIRARTRTQASITYQNFFLMYPKSSGMTGTGKTSETEFKIIYNLPVEVIATHRPMKRVDLPDTVYRDQYTKWNSIAEFVNQKQWSGQPILIGTTTVEKSEMLAELLNGYRLRYQVLNAKPGNARRESDIIAQAGLPRSITIATNMAGRGTDIILGGSLNFKVEKLVFNMLIDYQKQVLKELLLSHFKRNISETEIKFKNCPKFLVESKTSSIITFFNQRKKLIVLAEIVNNLKYKKKNSKIKVLIKYLLSKHFYIKSLDNYFIKTEKTAKKSVKQIQQQILKFRAREELIITKDSISIRKERKLDCSYQFFSVLLSLMIDKSFLKLSEIASFQILKDNQRISSPKESYPRAISVFFNELKPILQDDHNAENQYVKNLGGLYVIGTERNDSRRVDNQLRGRCGRQGDPGTSQFFLSLDDTLLRMFG